MSSKPFQKTTKGNINFLGCEVSYARNSRTGAEARDLLQTEGSSGRHRSFPFSPDRGLHREIMAIMQIDYGAAHRPHHGWVGVRSKTAALARVAVNSTKPVD